MCLWSGNNTRLFSLHIRRTKSLSSRFSKINMAQATVKNHYLLLRRGLLLKDLLYIYVVHCCTLQLPPVEAKTTIHKASLVCPTQQVCCDWLPCLPVSCLEPRALPHFLVSSTGSINTNNRKTKTIR